MVNSLLNPTFTGEGRVFINIDGYGCGSAFDFHNCMRIDGLDKSFGDVEPIYCPDPENYDSFVEIGVLKGGDSRWTSNLAGKLPVDTYSPLEVLANRGCTFALQVHYGRCTKPNDFQEFESSIILKDVRLTSYNLSNLVASNPGERAIVEETAAISASTMYRVFSPKITNVSGSALSGGLMTAIAYADVKACGGACNVKSDGNNVWVGMFDGTASQHIYTINGGATWAKVNTGGAVHSGSQNMTPIIVSGDKVYWAIQASGDASIYVSDLNKILSGTSQTPLELFQSDAAAFFDVDSTSNTVWFAGGVTAGLVVAVDKVSGLAIDYAPALNQNYLSISALDDDNVLVGAEAGLYIYSTSFGTFTLGQVNDITDDIIEVEMIDQNNWLAATATELYCTGDAGANWTKVLDINNHCKLTFYDELVGYMVTDGGIYRTIDGGNSWKKLYSLVSTMATSAVVNPYSPNMMFMTTHITGTTTQVIKVHI